MTAEQQSYEQYFITHTTQQQDGRFVVKLSTKMDPKQLGSPRLSAERRIHAIEGRLERDPELKVQYYIFMKEYEELSHMEPVKSQERSLTCYFYDIIQSSKKPVPQQRLELCSMEVPRLPMDCH